MFSIATLPCLSINYLGLEVLGLEVANGRLTLEKKTERMVQEDGGAGTGGSRPESGF